MPFQKGKVTNPKGGKKGNKGGTGRPATWYVNKAKEIIDKIKLLEFYGDVSSGEPIEEIPNPAYNPYSKKGLQEKRTIFVACSTRDRIAAGQILLDRALGKPMQQIESNSLDAFMVEYRARHTDK